MELYSAYMFWAVLSLVALTVTLACCWGLALIARVSYSFMTGGDYRAVFNEMMEEW